MTKLEKVIKGIEACLQETPECCKACPYHVFYPNGCIIERNRDALEMLKEREPRVLTWEEFREMKEPLDGESICYEIMQGNGAVLKTMLVKTFSTCEHLYNKAFRVWTARPTDEQRKAEKWDEKV